MRQFWFATPVIVVAVFSCSREPQSASSNAAANKVATGNAPNVEQLLIQAEREKETDIQSGRWHERWVADDCVSTNADGSIHVNPKPVVLANITSGAWRVESIAISNVNVRVFGNAAIVTAIQTEKSQFQGKDSGGRYQYTHVWVERDGRWQVVATHTTRLGPSTT